MVKKSTKQGQEDASGAAAVEVDASPTPAVVALVHKKNKRQKTKATPTKPEPEPVQTAFMEEMRIHEMARAWGLDDDDDDDDDGNNEEADASLNQQQQQEEEVLNGLGLGAVRPSTSAASVKQGSLEERLERAKQRAMKRKENRSIELADWQPDQNDDGEEEQVIRRGASGSRSTNNKLKRVKRAFD